MRTKIRPLVILTIKNKIMNLLKHKEDLAIKLLRQIPSDDVELCYSGGKDSDVILYLARLAGIPFVALYKNTTIDPPGTIKHCHDNEVQVLQPRHTFFELIECKGFPTRRVRYCCEILKEYKVKDHAILGIRRMESRQREIRYNEPQICRIYGNNERVKQYLPILNWTNSEVEEYIKVNNIRLHPLYYDENGRIDCRRRLGCMGCPLSSDNGKSDFRKYPKLLKQWLKHGSIWWDTHPNVISHDKFSSIYALMCHNLFFERYKDFVVYDYPVLFGETDWKGLLQDYFKIDL